MHGGSHWLFLQVNLYGNGFLLGRCADQSRPAPVRHFALQILDSAIKRRSFLCLVSLPDSSASITMYPLFNRPRLSYWASSTHSLPTNNISRCVTSLNVMPY